MNYLEEQQPQEKDQFSRGVGVSFALHAILLSFFTLKAVFFTPEQIDFSQAVRVDMVGLPDKEAKLPPAVVKENPKPAPVEKAPEKPEPKPEVKAPEKPAPKAEAPAKLPPKPTAKDDGINLEKLKNQQSNALDKLKAMAALEKLKQEAAEEKKAAPAAGTGKADSGAAPIRGNMVSPGTALTGLNKLQHDNYAADLNAHVKQQWQISEWLANRGYQAVAQVFIDSRGNILDRKIVKSSGNPSYDEEVLATIDRAAPFPAPPEKFLAIISADGIRLGFPE